MADENIKQVMLDAITDADSLERFINGSDSETVLTRLSAEYPTLQKAIKELFENGGLPATPFATKALMTASALVDGDYAVVTNDPVVNNNGLYLKTGGSWLLSKFNPLNKTQVDDAISAYDKSNHGKNIFIDITNHGGSEYVVPESYLNRKLFMLSGSPQEDVTVIFPDNYDKEIWISNGLYATTAKVYLKTATATSSRELLAGANSYLISGKLSVLSGGATFATLNNANFGKNITSDTPPITDSSRLVATTQYVSRINQRSVQLTVTGDTTITDNHVAFYRVIGSLISDAVITLPNKDTYHVIYNGTSGGKSLKIRTTAQNNESSYVVIPPAKAKGIYIADTWAREFDLTSTGNEQPPVTSTNLKYVGRFKVGGSYNAGDVVNHGSGIYRLASSVSNASSPLSSQAFVKIGHDNYAGANRSLEVISSTESDVPLGYFAAPTKMSRSGRVVFNNGSNPLKISRDWGKTWVSQHVFAPTGASWFRWTNELEDGELLCGVSQTDDPNPDKFLIYRSNGWNEDTGVADSWEVVHEIQRSGAIFVNWGFSQHKNFVLLAEYGLQRTGLSGSGNEDYGRYCYLSKDYGRTWETIFDLSEHTENIKVHLHGVCFDPYWNRIWISHGDGGGSGTNGLYYSDDLGKTWQWALQTRDQAVNFPQSVGIVALPTCILLSSDSYPNGLHRIDRAQGRIPHKGYYTVEAAYYIKNQQETLHHILGEASRAEWLPDAPYIWVYRPQTIAGKSGCIASWDGWNFYEVWESSETFTPTSGASSVVGVTPENEIIISGRRNASGQAEYWKVVCKVSID